MNPTHEPDPGPDTVPLPQPAFSPLWAETLAWIVEFAASLDRLAAHVAATRSGPHVAESLHSQAARMRGRAALIRFELSQPSPPCLSNQLDYNDALDAVLDRVRAKVAAKGGVQ